METIYMDKDKLAAKAADLAEELVEFQVGAHMMWEDREDGSEGLSDDAQDLFNEIQEIVLHHLNK